MWLIDKLKDTGGAAIGLLEMVGLKYKVKHYQAKVSEVLWRGSRLNPEDYADLKSRGFQTIINFCAERDMDTEPAKAAGLVPVRIPVIDNMLPKQSQVTEFLDIARNKDSGVCFAHCESGVGRTGIFCACYRISVCGWTNEQALAEAKSYGHGVVGILEDQQQFILKWGK